MIVNPESSCVFVDMIFTHSEIIFLLQYISYTGANCEKNKALAHIFMENVLQFVESLVYVIPLDLL